MSFMTIMMAATSSPNADTGHHDSKSRVGELLQFSPLQGWAHTGIDIVVLNHEENDYTHGNDVESMKPAHPLLQSGQPNVMSLR
jgi:hypothetical protein